VQVREEDDELVATHAGDGVSSAHTGTEALGQFAKQHVAHVMAEDVIDILESVQIHHEQAEAGLEALRALQRGLQPVIEQEAVGQSGERVVFREMAQPLFARAEGLGLLVHTMPQHGDPGESDKYHQPHGGEALQGVLRRPPGRRSQYGNVAGRAQQDVHRLSPHRAFSQTGAQRVHLHAADSGDAQHAALLPRRCGANRVFGKCGRKKQGTGAQDERRIAGHWILTDQLGVDLDHLAVEIALEGVAGRDGTRRGRGGLPGDAEAGIFERRLELADGGKPNHIDERAQGHACGLRGLHADAVFAVLNAQNAARPVEGDVAAHMHAMQQFGGRRKTEQLRDGDLRHGERIARRRLDHAQFAQRRKEGVHPHHLAALVE
jgi:hypothetical protein